MPKLSSAQIKAALAEAADWTQKGSAIQRTFKFKGFPEALKFVNAVGKIAERSNHHPDIDIRWNKVTLALTSHDEGGLTEKDFQLARKFDQL